MEELFCKTCKHFVQFPLDLSLNGDHYVTCPICKREHCRAVLNGNIIGHGHERRRGVPIDVDYYQVTTSLESLTLGDQSHSTTW